MISDNGMVNHLIWLEDYNKIVQFISQWKFEKSKFNSSRTNLMMARWKTIIRLSLMVMGLVALWGCASAPAQLTEAQAAAALAAPPDQETYTLGPEDTIEVSVWKEPELTKQIVIPPDGKISYPLIGEIKAAGLTVKQLRTEIHQRLEKFVSDANVTVILLKPQFYKIYVTGKVNKPGEFAVGRPPSVMQAISMAGGLTPFASPGSIVILRNVGGKEEVFPFNYKTVSRGESLDQNRILMPGDVVVVP